MNPFRLVSQSGGVRLSGDLTMRAGAEEAGYLCKCLNYIHLTALGFNNKRQERMNQCDEGKYKKFWSD